jgi:hypothetical protein
MELSSHLHTTLTCIVCLDVLSKSAASPPKDAATMARSLWLTLLLVGLVCSQVTANSLQRGATRALKQGESPAAAGEELRALTDA